MTLRLVFRRAARQDFEDAALWYDGRRPGLGGEFQAAIEDALRLIQTDPLMYPRVHLLVRRVRVRRFPYAVYFLVESDRIVVLAVFHARRDPRVWQSRA
jgi:plasmid stabilization system protein ParE